MKKLPDKFIAVCVILGFLSVLLGYLYSIHSPGYRAQLLVSDFFGDYQLTVPLRFFRAHSYESQPTQAHTLRNRETIVYSNASLSQLNKKIQEKKDKFQFNSSSDDFTLYVTETEQAVYYLIEHDGQKSCFCLLNVKGSQQSRYLRFFNMELLLFTKEPISFSEEEFVTAVPVPFHLIDDTRLISNDALHGRTGIGILGEYYSAGSKEDFLSFYRELDRFFLEEIEQGFRLFAKEDISDQFPIPLEFYFRTVGEKTYFCINLI